MYKTSELILLKFCQNVPNRIKINVTNKFAGARLSLFRVMVNNMMVRARKLPPREVIGLIQG